MIYSYTKCESVIAKIMADLDADDVRQRTTDIKEWIFEAVDKIGAPTQYIQVESGVDGVPLLKIEDGQVPLPHGIQTLDGVAYSHEKNGPWVVADKSTAIFNKLGPTKKHCPDVKVTNTTPPHDPNNYVINNTGVVEFEHQLPAKKLITSQSQIYTQNLNGLYDKSMIHDQYNHPCYFIKPGWLVINRPNGYIKLSYKAIATDERGYPLIPDLSSYIEAIYWYVVMKLSFPKFMSGKLGGRGVNSAASVYTYTQQQWAYYRNQAYTDAMMPTADDMRNIKHDWNKLIMDYDSDNSFFKHQRDPQTIYNDYYYGY